MSFLTKPTIIKYSMKVYFVVVFTQIFNIHVKQNTGLIIDFESFLLIRIFSEKNGIFLGAMFSCNFLVVFDS